MDPLQEFFPSLNPYNYVGNNPIRGIDHDGRSWYWNEEKQDWDENDDGDDTYYVPDAETIVVTAEDSDESSSSSEYNSATRAVCWWFFDTDDVDRVLYDGEYFHAVALPTFMLAIIPGGKGTGKGGKTLLRSTLKKAAKSFTREQLERIAKKLGFVKRISPQRAPFNSHG